jgi:hypothetical protein
MRYLTTILILSITSLAHAGHITHVEAKTDKPHIKDENFDWIFPKHPNTHINFGPNNHVPKPEKTFDTANWSHSFIEHLWLKGLDSYSLTGHVPNTAIWNYLDYRYELNPGRFDYYHPYFEGMFTPAKTIGLLPQGPFWNNIVNKYNLDTPRFSYYHPLLVVPLERNAAALASVPEPTSGTLLLIAVPILGWIVYSARKGCNL